MIVNILAHTQRQGAREGASTVAGAHAHRQKSLHPADSLSIVNAGDRYSVNDG